MVITIEYGIKKIAVAVEQNKRKNLSITVHPDLTVTAKAPVGCDKSEIEHKLNKRVGWMVKQLDFFEQYHPIQPARQFISGETHYYLGKQYRLRIKKNTNAQVRLIGKYFEMDLIDPADQNAAQALMKEWYAVHARELIQKRVQQYLSLFPKKIMENLEIKFRYMQKRWGSCTGTKVLFNIELIKVPMDCIDYVIVHELCHIIQPNHDNHFYVLLKKILPDWEARKERLEQAVLV